MTDSASSIPSSPVSDLPSQAVKPLKSSGAAGSFETFQNGAHVTSWKSAEHGELLFLSSKSEYGEGKAIRGGIPVCFPWFGKGLSGDKQPGHGFARRLPWRILSQSSTAAGEWSIKFGLSDTDLKDEDYHQAFPHRFQAQYSVEFSSRTLKLNLEVKNTGVKSFDYEAALHTYFAISDIEEVSVTGLEEGLYLDKSDSAPTTAELTQSGSITFGDEVDRIYRSGKTVKIVDPGNSRVVTIAKRGSANTVVWNPGAEKAALLSDLGAEEWRKFICVESANIGADAIKLEPGQSHQLQAQYSVLAQQ